MVAIEELEGPKLSTYRLDAAVGGSIGAAALVPQVRCLFGLSPQSYG